MVASHLKYLSCKKDVYKHNNENSLEVKKILLDRGSLEIKKAEPLP